MYKFENGKKIDLTESEIKDYNALQKTWSDEKISRKLRQIKRERLQKLQETDWWVLRGNMTTAQSNYRQALRDIPNTYSESDYDLLLTRNENGELTHTVWSKP